MAKTQASKRQKKATKWVVAEVGALGAKETGLEGFVLSDAPMKPAQKKRVLHIDQLVRRLIGDDDATDRWMNTPMHLFHDKTPREHAATAKGAREIEELIEQMKHGVFG